MGSNDGPTAVSFSGRVEVTDGLYLAYRALGAGEQTLLVPSASWIGADLEPLAAGRRLVAYDLRGRGRSAAVLDERLLGLAQDVADLETLRAALGIERLALLGWSYHGAVAARYALEHPGRVERLVLCAPTAPQKNPYFHGFLERFVRRVDLAALAELERARRQGVREGDLVAWSRAVHQVYFRAYVVDPACLERLRSDPAVEPNFDAERVNNQGRRVLEMLGEYDWREDFRAFDVPTLLVHGSEDPVMMAGSELWRTVLPDARLLRLEGVGHLPWIERPDLFFPAIETFLGGDWPVAARAAG